jgi:hypothetical protein
VTSFLLPADDLEYAVLAKLWELDVASVARAEVEKARAQQAVSRLLGATPRAAVAALVDAVDAFDPKLLDASATRRASRSPHSWCSPWCWP